MLLLCISDSMASAVNNMRLHKLVCFAELLIHVAQVLVYRVKALIHVAEPLVNMVKALVNRVKALINMVKTLVNMIKPLIDYIKALVNYVKASGCLVDLLGKFFVETVNTVVDGAKIFVEHGNEGMFLLCE